MQKLKKVLKSLIKSKSKKPEKAGQKAAPKKLAAKPAAKAAKPKAKALEKTAAKKAVQKPAKKEAPAKSLAKAPAKLTKKPELKPAAKTEPKLEAKANLKKGAKSDAKTETKAEAKSEAKSETKTEKISEKAHKLAAAEKAPDKAPAKLKAKKAKDVEAVPETEKEDDPVEAKREYVDEEIYLTDADGRRYCRVKECDQVANVDAYCRYHYLLFWKKIQVRKKILTEGKLERYVEELTARYPDKYLEMLRKDLRSEKDFLNAIQELELDENAGENDLEDEAQSYIEEVRGMSTEGGASSRDDDEF